MSASERRIRITVTLSPRLVKLVDARARQRADHSRSATIETMLEQAELERQVRDYYAQPDVERDDDEAFWSEVRTASRALDAKDRRAHPKKRRQP